jgi:hypothetical protein
MDYMKELVTQISCALILFCNNCQKQGKTSSG